eukprot:superscaffoldBa00004833_g19509
MEKVASHINEMQKIYEDYGSVFDQLAAEQSGPDKQVTELSMGEFLVHSSVVWLNPLPCLGRLRKEPELTLFVFKRAVILVYRENSKLKKRMTGSRSADLDPFRFRWLIPVSAVQVRPANITGSEQPCVWELVHCRSEVEGRPETVFQLCSSGLETKAGVLRVLRSLLRDRAPAGSLRRTKLSTAERGGSWRRRQQRSRSDTQRTPHRQPDESCRLILGDTCSEPLLPSHAASSAGKRSRLCSLTSDLEAQLQRLNFSEEDAEHRDDEKRRSSGREQLDLSSLLERDFSVQSMTSIINEDCFYDAMLGIQKTAGVGIFDLQGLPGSLTTRFVIRASTSSRTTEARRRRVKPPESACNRPPPRFTSASDPTEQLDINTSCSVCGTNCVTTITGGLHTAAAGCVKEKRFCASYNAINSSDKNAALRLLQQSR